MLEFALRGDAVTAFIVIGAVGLALVLLSLLLGEVFEGLFGGLDIDVGGGIFSAPVLGSFLASFGFGAALIVYATGAGAALGALGGLASGLVVGGIALAMMRSLVNMPTDDTVSTSGLAGSAGVVITAIPADGFGEVTVRHHGSQHKYNARALEPIPAGSPVRVTAVLSASAVQVERASD
ncbi:NfeD family protein [Egicoccus sp. AB-alg2]|uniref:NfeD family protein n=1 Tax=Egicoccus sp. AB-alg2 TaxID=3242693 RepID=UPI00359D0663